jgi:hypothetical protein
MMLMKEGPSDEGPRGSRHVMRWRCYGVDMCQWSCGWCRRVLVLTCLGEVVSGCGRVMVWT